MISETAASGSEWDLGAKRLPPSLWKERANFTPSEETQTRAARGPVCRLVLGRARLETGESLGVGQADPPGWHGCAPCAGGPRSLLLTRVSGLSTPGLGSLAPSGQWAPDHCGCLLLSSPLSCPLGLPRGGPRIKGQDEIWEADGRDFYNPFSSEFKLKEFKATEKRRAPSSSNLQVHTHPSTRPGEACG